MWFGDVGKGAHEATMGGQDYELQPGARRFDLGNYNFPGVVAAERSLAIIEQVGTAAIEAHVTGLARWLVGGLMSLGLPVAGGAAGPHTGSIVCIGTIGAGGHDSTEDRAVAALSERLSAGGVVHTIRRGAIRLAFHLYNDEADVERVLDLARTATPSRVGESA